MYRGIFGGFDVEEEAAGIPGAVVATLGLITPSVIIILIIARVLAAFRQNKVVDAAFYGLRPCSVGLIAAAGLLVVKIALFDFDLFKETGVLWEKYNALTGRNDAAAEYATPGDFMGWTAGTVLFCMDYLTE